MIILFVGLKAKSTNYTKQLSEFKEKLKTVEDTESWLYKSTKSDIDKYTRYLKDSERQLKNVKTRIERMEIDFEGKDKPENIDIEIAKIDEEINNLEEISKKKLIEYEAQYILEQKNSKTIADHIKDFENDTNSLYDSKDNESYSIDLPRFDNNYERTTGYKDIDLAPINSLISRGCTQEELLSVLPKDLHNGFRNINGYKFFNLKNNNDVQGIQYGKDYKYIGINLSSVGNNPHKFVDTLMHEVEHADQEAYYNYLKSQDYLTKDEEEYINKYEEKGK